MSETDQGRSLDLDSSADQEATETRTFFAGVMARAEVERLGEAEATETRTFFAGRSRSDRHACQNLFWHGLLWYVVGGVVLLRWGCCEFEMGLL